MSKILNFSILGKRNSGKCSLNKAINLFTKELLHPKDFVYNNNKYHIFPIPCCGNDLKDNFDISIKNSDFILITIDSNELNDINKENNYYAHLILLSIINGIQNIIFVLTKCIGKDMNELYEKIKTKFNIDNIKMSFDFCFIDSLEGYGIEELLNKFPKNVNIDITENKNNPISILGLYDKYPDKEREEFVISCKIINECNKNSLNINETKLNLFYIDDKLNELKQIKDIIPFKLSLADGNYVEKLDDINNQFISLKFKLNSIENNFINNPLRNCFLSFNEKDENICFFDTFEADIMITSFLSDEELKEKIFTILTKGCKCLFSNYNSDIECTIINIVGEYENNNSNISKKKIINCKNGVSAKILINLTRPILATKFDICNKFGSFRLLKDGECFALGKINKYKPFKK